MVADQGSWEHDERTGHSDRRSDQAFRSDHGGGRPLDGGAAWPYLWIAGTERVWQDHDDGDAARRAEADVGQLSTVWLDRATPAGAGPHRGRDREPGLLSEPVGAGESRVLPSHLRTRFVGRGRPPAPEGGTGGPGRRPLPYLLARDEAAAGDSLRPAGRPGAGVPGRAHQRPGPGGHDPGARVDTEPRRRQQDGAAVESPAPRDRTGLRPRHHHLEGEAGSPGRGCRTGPRGQRRTGPHEDHRRREGARNTVGAGLGRGGGNDGGWRTFRGGACREVGGSWWRP